MHNLKSSYPTYPTKSGPRVSSATSSWMWDDVSIASTWHVDLKSVEDHAPCNLEWRRFRRAHSDIARCARKAHGPPRLWEPKRWRDQSGLVSITGWPRWIGFDVKDGTARLCLWQLIRQVLFCACCGASKTAVAKGPDALQALRP